MTLATDPNQLGKYLTLEELIALHGEENLLPLAGVGGFNSSTGRQIDQARLQAQIDRAQSLIDGYVLGRYPDLAKLPTDKMLPSLKGAAADLVLYWLRDRAGDKGLVDDVVQSRYREVIRWLERIADGKFDLGLPADFVSEEPTSQIPDGINGSFPPSRAHELLEGF